MWERFQSEVLSEWTPECPSWREPYGCNECEEVFTDQSSFTRHMRSHTGERNYECKFYQKAFSRKMYLIIHQRIQTKEKLFESGNAFSSSSYLNQHEKSAHW